MKRPSTKTVGRAVFLAVAVGAAWYLGSGFARLYREWQAAVEPPAESQTTAPELGAMASVLPLAGPWTFAEMDWNLRSETMKRGDVDRRFRKLSVTSPGEHAAELPDVGQELSDYIAKLQLLPVDRAGNSVYVLDKPSFKAELVVRDVAGKRKTVGMVVGLPTTGDDWQVFELTPRGLSPNAKLAEAHLLPLPSTAVRRGGRFADDGRLLLELISLDTNADALVSAWKDAGWEVCSSGLGDANAFSLLCAHGDEVIYALSANPRESLHNLMLVRSPSDAEIQALQ